MPHANPALDSLSTLHLAHQAGWSAGERSRRRRGARGWSIGDWRAAHEAFEAAMQPADPPEPDYEAERRLGVGDAAPPESDMDRVRRALQEVRDGAHAACDESECHYDAEQ